ncbi:MAG: hypothetical protein ACP5UA_00830 [Candidatus Hydrogenedens sp.]
MKKVFAFILLLLFLITPFLSLAFPGSKSLQKQELEKTRNKILDYIRKNKLYFRVEDLILLDYLQRRFNLPDEFSFNRSFVRIPTSQDIKSLEIYGRLINYTGIHWKKPNQAESYIWLELKALFIDRREDCPDKITLIRQIKEQSKQGGYKTTHSALALSWFIEQECLSTSDNDVQQLINEVIHQIYSITLSISFPSDLKIEALAFICYLGKKKIINPEEIYHLLSFQRDDGAFSGTGIPSDGVNIHTTLLMFWLTHEFLNEDILFTEPMIVKRSKS